MAEPITGLDPQTQQLLQGLLSYVQPQQSDMDQLKRDAIMRFGLGLMGARKGSEWATIGQSGMNALNQRNQELTQLQTQRGQSIQQGMGLLGQARSMQQLKLDQEMAKNIAALFKSGGGTTASAGPPQAFQLPGGAAGGMNALVGSPPSGVSNIMGQAPTAGPSFNQLPTSTETPNDNGDLVNKLSELNIQNVVRGGKDWSAAIKNRFPEVVSLRANAGYIDRNGIVHPGTSAPTGYIFNPQTQKLEPIAGGQEAVATAAAIPDLVRSFTTPQTTVDENGVPRQGGTVGQSLFGNKGALGALPGVVGGRPAPILDPSLTPAQRAMALSDNANPSAGVTSPPPARGVPLGQSPEQAAVSKELGDYQTGVHVAATNASQSQARLDEMSKLIPKIPFGAYAPLQLDIAKHLLPFSEGAANFVAKDASNTVPAMQVFGKMATNMVIEQSKQLGTREAAQVIQMVANANPNIAWTKAAAETVMDYLKGSNEWASAREQAMSKWVKSKGSASGFQEDWNTNHPMSDYIPPMSKIEAALTTGDITRKTENPAPQSTGGWSIKRVQ